MARILVLNVKVPFTAGGQDVLVQTLSQELKRREHLVDIIELPFHPVPKEALLEQAALWRALKLDEFAGVKVDLVIATKFPSYYARHQCKSLWLVHQHRPIYDLYGTRFCDFSDDPRDEALRRMLTEGDQQVIGECAFVSGISKNVVERLHRYNGISGAVLYPPLPQGNRYRCEKGEDYILSVGRICSIKRVDLVLKALTHVARNIKLKIVGTPDEPGVMEYLKNEIAKHHLWERVDFLGRVDNEVLLDLYAKALAVYYAPYNEDYGYVTLEALASGKPLITAKDSGGVLEFVEYERHGLVVEPTVEALGAAINRLVQDRAWAERLGQAGREFVEKSELMEQGWDQIVDRLLSPLPRNGKHGA